MRPTWKRLTAAAAFTALTAIQVSVLPQGGVGASALIWLLLLAATIGYFAWPAVSKAAVERGSTLEPSWLRLAWSAAVALLFTVPFFFGVRLLQRSAVDLSQVLAALFYFAVMAYLAWPGARREIARRHER